MGVPAAKRFRTDADTEAKIDNALFDPSLASGLLTQIKELLTLVSKAAQPDGKLYTPSSANGEGEHQAEAAEEDANDSGANIALGSMAWTKETTMPL